MAHYTCEKLIHTLNFLPDRVNFCCSYAEGPSMKYSNTGSINIKSIIKEKKKIIKQLKYGSIPKECEGCIEYKEKNYKNIFDFLFSNPSLSVNSIIVNHFKQCSCRCIYCAQKIIWGDETGQNYELLPIIKELYKHNAADKDNLNVEFQGGDVTVLNEFEPLLKEFIKGGCRKFTIFTNGIKYLPIIAEAAETAHINMSVSLDSGTRETFKKVKQADAFDKVLDNVKKYGQNNISINLKYIIIKDVNDNAEELEAFLNAAEKTGCIKGIVLDIDFRDMLFGKHKEFKAPPHYKDLVKQASDFCSKKGIDFTLNSYAAKYV